MASHAVLLASKWFHRDSIEGLGVHRVQSPGGRGGGTPMGLGYIHAPGPGTPYPFIYRSISVGAFGALRGHRGLAPSPIALPVGLWPKRSKQMHVRMRGFGGVLAGTIQWASNCICDGRIHANLWTTGSWFGSTICRLTTPVTRSRSSTAFPSQIAACGS